MAITMLPSEVPVREVSAPEILAVRPTVSILTITFNHAKFVAECIESAMGQQTNFPFEMVIGEDCSTDETRRICLDYQRKYPGRIRLLLPERNTGNFENFRRVLAACRGEYIALLEGDDYWTAPDKLAVQVELLRTHADWSACIHNVTVLNEQGIHAPQPFFETDPGPVFREADFAERNFVPTCSCVFRHREPLGLPDWYYDPQANPYPDWILHVVNARQGLFGYIHRILGVHRRHAGGVWGGTFDGTVEGDIRRMLKRQVAFERLQECMDPRLGAAVRRQRAWTAYHLSLAYREKGDWPSVRRCLWEAFCTDRSAGIPFLRSALIATMPGLRRIGKR